jgi:hypothetical protein
MMSTGSWKLYKDSAANVTVNADHKFDELRRRYQTDESLRMNGTVFNMLRGQVETVWGGRPGRARDVQENL